MLARGRNYLRGIDFWWNDEISRGLGSFRSWLEARRTTIEKLCFGNYQRRALFTWLIALRAITCVYIFGFNLGIRRCTNYERYVSKYVFVCILLLARVNRNACIFWKVFIVWRKNYPFFFFFLFLHNERMKSNLWLIEMIAHNWPVLLVISGEKINSNKLHVIGIVFELHSQFNPKINWN